MVEERDDEATKKQNAQHRLIQVDGAIFTRLFSYPVRFSFHSVDKRKSFLRLSIVLVEFENYRITKQL